MGLPATAGRRSLRRATARLTGVSGSARPVYLPSHAKPTPVNRLGRNQFVHIQQALGNRSVAHLAQAAVLKTSRRGDPYEQEAERMAREVVTARRRPSGSGLQTVSPPDGVIRSMAGSGNLRASGEVATSARRITTSGGERLSVGARTFMEGQFGADLSDVRIHADSSAAALAAAMSARAFTVGSHIFFATGAFGPESDAGRWLLAHELAHVIQQRSGVDLIQRYDESTEPRRRRPRLCPAVQDCWILPHVWWMPASACSDSES